MNRLDIDLEQVETAASGRMSRARTSDSSSSSRTASLNLEVSQDPTQISRWQSQRLQHIHTVGSARPSRSESDAGSKSLPAFGGGKPYPPSIPAEREAYVVDFDGPNDPLHPLNWSFKTK